MNNNYQLFFIHAGSLWHALGKMVIGGQGRGQGRSKRKYQRIHPTPLALAMAIGLQVAASAQSGAQAATLAAGTLPTGAQVTAGSASISQSGQAMTVTQDSQRAAINWQSFSIGREASVNFVQPNASAVVLNRVTGAEQSVIEGALRANGQVFLLNPNGILFAAGARVDTAGLVASTRNLSDADFMAGTSTFAGTGAGDVVNAGNLSAMNAADGGYVALIGRQVKNDGVINARLGSVALASGNRVSLNFNGNSLVGVTVDQGTLNALVSNGGAVLADGGTVWLKASAAEQLLGTVVNNTGEIRAQSVAEHNGKIVLLGDGGTVEVAGKLDVTNPGSGDGGFIETSGPAVVVHDGAIITAAAITGNGNAGTWLIDPTDFAIDAGSGAQTLSGMGANTLQNALAVANVVIQTTNSGTQAGNININAPVTWSTNKLTLEAYGDINVNAVLTATGTSTLDLKTGYNFNTSSPAYDTSKGVRMKSVMDGSGNAVFVGRIDIDRAGTGILSINGAGYTLVNQLGTPGDEQLYNGTLQGLDLFTNYALSSNIDASATAGWNSGAGFTPIADNYYPYVGKFEGLGHSISGLTINQPAPRHVALFQVGLFGLADGASFSNLALTDVNIIGSGQVGALLGGTINNAVSIANVIVSGTVTATNTSGGTGSDVGGLIGVINNSGTSIVNAYSSATVLGSADNIGGLVGTSTGAVITGSSASGTVTGANAVGGLVGKGQASTAISASSATGGVLGQTGVGGLVGVLDSQSGGNTVTTSFASGNVTGNENVGGLVGDSPYSGTVINTSYASGSVQAVRFVGGFIGTGNALISDAYATGDVTATDPSVAFAGGFSGGGAGTMVMNRVYASGTVRAADLGNSFGSGGLSGFGFYTVTNSFYDATKNPNGSAVNLGTGKSTTEMNTTATYLAAGWDFTFGSGTWGRKNSLNSGYPVLKAFGYSESIVVDLGVDSRAYGDANASLAGASITGCPTINCAGLITNLSWGSALDTTTSAGSYALSGTGVLVYTYGSGLSSATFDITYVNPAFDITPRIVTVATVTGATRAYDGTAGAAASLFALGNIVNGDSVTLSGSAVLDGINAGSRSVASAGTLALDNANYQLASAAPAGNVIITPGPDTNTATATTINQDGVDSAVSSAQRTQVIRAPQPVLPPASLLPTAPASMMVAASSQDLPIEGVTLNLARRMLLSQAGANPQELRVPVGRDSLLETINGGVKLPEGVEQVLFVRQAAQ